MKHLLAVSADAVWKGREDGETRIAGDTGCTDKFQNEATVLTTALVCRSNKCIKSQKNIFHFDLGIIIIMALLDIYDAMMWMMMTRDYVELKRNDDEEEEPDQ